MLIYHFVLLISLFFGIIEIFQDYKFKYIHKILILTLIASIFGFFSFNKTNNDYQAYLQIFKNEKNVEIGYVYIIKIIKFFGGNHQTIVLGIGILLSIYLLFEVLKKTKYSILIISLYFSQNFIYDLNQLRNTLCYLIILFGLNCLSENKNTKYIFLNFLAISFQRLGIIYLLYFLLSKINKKSYYKIITILSIGGIFAIPIIKMILLKFFPDKASIYFGFKVSKGFLFYYILCGLDLLVLKIAGAFETETKEEDIYLKFILFPIIFLPYGVLSIEIISRVYRNALFIKWILIFKKIRFEKLKLRITVVLLSLLGAALPIIVTYYKDKEFLLKLLKTL
ncbi:MAG: EpsG family protein [Cetobacterium sp.]